MNKYKASIPPPDIGSEYFVSSTWTNYGFWVILATSWLAHKIMYYIPEEGTKHNGDLLDALTYNTVGVFCFFILNIVVQNFHVLGKYISIFCCILNFYLIAVILYISLISHFPLADLGSVIYFGFAAYLYDKDYKLGLKS